MHYLTQRIYVLSLSICQKRLWKKLGGLRLKLGLKDSARIVKTSCEDANTFSVKCNGGLYIIPKCFSAHLFQDWKHFAKKLVELPAALRKWYKHVDQVSFVMVMLDMSEDIVEIPLEYNFPMHWTDRFKDLSF